MYYFIRHGKLALPYKNHEDMPFEVLADLASGKLSPLIDKDYALSLLPKLSESVPFEKLEAVYSSPAERCRDTGRLIMENKFGGNKNAPEINILPELIEASFDLRRIYETPPTRIDITEVNRKVLAAIFSGQGAESFQNEIFDRKYR